MFLSFIVPMYNRETLIGRCLDSILEQGVEDIEIICIDDASTDETRGVVEEYLQKYDNIKMVINEQNRGQAYARNRGIEIAQGKYIWFVDSDDYIINNAIVWLKECCNREKVDLVCFDMLKISDKGSTSDTIALIETNKVTSGEELFCAFSRIQSVKASVCRQIYLREFIEKYNLRFTVGYIAEDSFFDLKSLVLAPRAMYVKKSFYASQISYNSTCTYAKEIDYFKGIFMAYCDIWQFWQSQKWTKELSENLVAYLMTRYRYASRYYHPKIRKEIDVWIEKQNETVKYLYLLFKEQNRGYYIREIKNDQCQQIENAEKIYVFGAGRMAYEIAVILNQMEKSILAYIVSDYTTDNPKAIYGVPVSKIGELKEIDKDALVVIATVPRYYDGIIDTLKEYGLNNVLKIVE